MIFQGGGGPDPMPSLWTGTARYVQDVLVHALYGTADLENSVSGGGGGP